MSFGNPVTDGALQATGTNGYIVAFDLVTELPALIYAVQCQNAADFSTVATEVKTWPELLTLLEASSVPEIAYTVDGNIVSIFVKSATFPYEAATEAAAFLYRNSVQFTLTTSYFDIPPDARSLLKYLALRILPQQSGERVPDATAEAIRRERARLGV